MIHPKTFLLQKVAGYKENGLETLGQLQGKHFQDLANVMMQFTEQTMLEVIDRLNKGENIDIGGTVISLLKS